MHTVGIICTQQPRKHKRKRSCDGSCYLADENEKNEKRIKETEISNELMFYSIGCLAPKTSFCSNDNNKTSIRKDRDSKNEWVLYQSESSQLGACWF